MNSSLRMIIVTRLLSKVVLLAWAALSHTTDAADTQPSAEIPAWFPKAPPLPPATGEIIRVATADEFLAAVDRVAPGGTILLADGQYKLPRTAVLQRKRNIAIRGVSGDPAKAILSGKGWDSPGRGDDLLHIGQCDGITIADLTFTDCRSYGIKVEAENAPANIHIYNCRFQDIGVRAIKGSAGQDPKIRAMKGSVRFCYFENTKIPPADWLYGGDYIAAIDMMALEDWAFSDNIFRNVKGRNGGGRAAIFIWVRSKKIVVERNLIVNCDRGVAFGNPGQATSNAPGERLVYVLDGIIRNNFIAGGPDCGIELWHADQIKVFNNTIWRPERNWARGIRIGTGTSRSDVANNLVHGEIRLEGGDAQLRQNLARKLDGYFVEPAAGNLALTSAAQDVIDQGVSLPEVTDDIRGRLRTGRLDLGAWELDGLDTPSSAATTVVLVNPRDGVRDVSVQTTVQIHFSNGLTLTSIIPDSVRLLKPDGTQVNAQLGSDLEADVVNLQPKDRLAPRTSYLLEVNR
ncbi:MAG: right-handed parallel beta-helix repeat-containing protein, partial [Verrucomicrobia bacterium]|nr:right-handed parallel beta-helix repeat-containing protein [Verrucomicrobiota bacterium]